jgi:hypothetical protein
MDRVYLGSISLFPPPPISRSVYVLVLVLGGIKYVL